MFVARRLLPSISSLLALEAVDRLGSATAAAEDLHLTHSAVSRQLKVLEGQLGVSLLERDGVRLCLTPQAEEYCEAVRTGLRDLYQASLRLKANPAGGSLNLGILPAFGMHWLAPKLPELAVAHPEITVNLITRLEPFDFERDNIDAAIHFGDRDWRGVNYLELSGEEVLAVAAPGLIPSTVDQAKELLRYPLLHLETRPDAWEHWFATHKLEASQPTGMLFDQFATLAQATILGMGIALLPDYIAKHEVASGRLVPVFGKSIPVAGRYYLVWPERNIRRAPLKKFVNWLKSEI